VHGELSETFPVDRVTTGHLVTRTTRAEQVFLTHGTIAPVFARFAIVTLVQCHVDAHAAFITVFEIIPTADATKATVVTMVRLFFITHPQITNDTMILAEWDVTIDTVVGLAALSGVAVPTNDFANREPVNGVMIVFWLGCPHDGKATRQRRAAVVPLTTIVDFGRSVGRSLFVCL
jgi:hypothetical protein